MKKKYAIPELEVILLNSEDIIITSLGEGETTSPDEPSITSL